MTAYFIVLEGVDGSGKSYQAAQVAAWLRSRGRTVFECADSKCGVWGAAARAWIQDSPLDTPRAVVPSRLYPIEGVLTDDEYLCACFVKSRAELALQIADALARGDDVVCDRWEPSTWAYQLSAGVPTSRVLRWVRRHTPVVQPDLTLWLRVSPSEAVRRVHQDASIGRRSAVVARFETAAFLAEVTSCYEGMPDMIRVDGAQAPDDVTRELTVHVEHLLRDGRLVHRPGAPTGSVLSGLPALVRNAWCSRCASGRTSGLRGRELRRLSARIRRARVSARAPARPSA